MQFEEQTDYEPVKSCLNNCESDPMQNVLDTDLSQVLPHFDC